MNTIMRIFVVAFGFIAFTLIVNAVLIYKLPSIEPALWIGAQSLIVTIAAGAYSVKTRINHFIGREVDFLGVFGVSLAIQGGAIAVFKDDKFVVPDGCIYIAISVIGIILLWIDYDKYKNNISRKITKESISTFKETNTEITIVTTIKK